MKAGPLNKWVTIQRPVETQGGSLGDPKATTWSDVRSVWAAIEPITGREAIILVAQPVATAVTRIRVRYFDGLTSKMRVLYGTRVFQIIAPPSNKNEDNDEVHLLCQEVESE